MVGWKVNCVVRGVLGAKPGVYYRRAGWVANVYTTAEQCEM
jgi:hypothetical protein